jgi:hypothetical protein
VLEGESEQTISNRLRLFQERALPDLERNIKCGNSLISSDFYAQQALPNMEEQLRVNVFDWNGADGFPDIMQMGGFDAVIGNPPYGVLLLDKEKLYVSNRYPFVSDFESSQYFLVRSEEVTKQDGFVSFIVPNTLFLNLYAQKFRNFLVTSFVVKKVANLANVDVFKNATVRTVIPLLSKGSSVQNFVDFTAFKNTSVEVLTSTIQQEVLSSNDKTWSMNLGPAVSSAIAEKIASLSTSLGSILEVSQGLIPYDKYRGHDEQTIKNRVWHADYQKDATYKQELRGGDVTRYCVTWNQKQWISYGPWLAAPRRVDFFTKPRILFREITDPTSGLLHAAYTDKEFYNNPGIINAIERNTSYSLFYILGLVNSKLLAFWHFSSSPKARKGVFPKILVNDVRNLPICTINFTSPTSQPQQV